MVAAVTGGKVAALVVKFVNIGEFDYGKCSSYDVRNKHVLYCTLDSL